MKAIVGIDVRKAYLPALDLFARLKFEKPSVELLHAVTLECPMTLPDAHAEAEYSKVVQNRGLLALDAAADDACSRGITAQTRLVFARAADGINAKAASDGADIVVVGATHCGRISNSYLDSATCALAIDGRTSLLVTKGLTAGRRGAGVRAVLAVDHSAHQDRVIDKLIEFAPRGIVSIQLLSAFRVDDDIALVTGTNPAALGGDVDRWVAEQYQQKTEAIASRLREAGYSVSVCVVESEPNDAIRHVMQSSHADLLIIGAVGNSTQSQARIGSVAVHQIGYESHPVLMLRG